MGNFSTLISRDCLFLSLGPLFTGLTYTGTIRLLFLEGDSQTKKHNPYVHRFIFYWLYLHVLPVCLLKCRSSLQTDILHAFCAVYDYKSSIELFISFNTIFIN